MTVLTIRTDKPKAEIGIFDGSRKLAYETWQAHQILAETIHEKIQKLLKTQTKAWPDIEAIVAYKGPGSFTGLRIGLSVANSLAYSLQVPIVGSTGKDWIKNGLNLIEAGQNEKFVLPKYGAPAHITAPK